jgi:hypothetical protein
MRTNLYKSNERSHHLSWQILWEKKRSMNGLHGILTIAIPYCCSQTSGVHQALSLTQAPRRPGADEDRWGTHDSEGGPVVQTWAAQNRSTQARQPSREEPSPWESREILEPVGKEKKDLFS